jgi:hypothetical protein
MLGFSLCRSKDTVAGVAQTTRTGADQKCRSLKQTHISTNSGAMKEQQQKGAISFWLCVGGLVIVAERRKIEKS